jgi:hypothetical protein
MIDDIGEIAAQLMVAARALLFALDLLDEHVPRLKPVSNFLGTLLGGRKQRFGE